jgi:hypothetical protein
LQSIRVGRKSRCGQIEFEAVMKIGNDSDEFRSIACARVRAAEMHEKREEQAKPSLKTILKQSKNQQDEHRK